MASSPKSLPTSFLGEVAARISTAIWVYDFDHARILQANSAALKVWDAETEEDLLARDLFEDMSPGVRKRLSQYQNDLVDPERCFTDVWTVYPLGKPLTLNITYRGIVLPDGRLALLCEGVPVQASEPENVRSVEALLHTTVKISMFATSGDVFYLNPAARSARAELDLGLAERFANRAEGERFLEMLGLEGQCKTVARVNTADGERWHEISGSRCGDPITGTQAYLVSELDVTELKLAERRAEAADRAKSSFLANMSHELRTPLNAIIGFSDFILSGKIPGTVPEKYAEYTADIHTSGQHLLRLINDVLDLAKVEAGEMPIVLDPIDVAKSLDGLERIMMSHARQKGVRLIVDPVASGLIVKADELRFRQVLMNLLSNAIKFTGVGGDIALKAEQDGDMVAITVTDTGIGMTKAEIEESMKPFRQVDSAITRENEGTGLGLPLSKSLIEAQGGSLKISSEPGRGTRVTVLMPTSETDRLLTARTG